MTTKKNRNRLPIVAKGIADPYIKIGKRKEINHGEKRSQSQTLASQEQALIIMPDMPTGMPMPGGPPPGAGIVPRPMGPPGASPGIMTPTPAAAPSANLGAQAHAAGQMKQALQMVEMALPQLPLDSPLHKVATSFIMGVAKHIGSAGGADQGIQMSMLRDLALRAQQSSPQLRPAGPPGAPGAPAPSPAGA